MRKIILGLGIAALLAAAAGCSSSSSDPATSSGTLHIFGSTTSVSATSLPVTLRGLVTAAGSLPLGGNATKATITTNIGDLNLSHTNPPAGQPAINTANCTARQITAGTFKILGGTGKFDGATGHGDYTLSFSAKFALTHGKCVITQTSTPVSGTETFRATGPLTIKG